MSTSFRSDNHHIHNRLQKNFGARTEAMTGEKLGGLRLEGDIAPETRTR